MGKLMRREVFAENQKISREWQGQDLSPGISDAEVDSVLRFFRGMYHEDRETRRMQRPGSNKSRRNGQKEWQLGKAL